MKKHTNDDPFAPWNNPMNDSPFAPHNGPDADNPSKPWNSPFGRHHLDRLTDEEAKYYRIKRDRYDGDDYYSND